MPSDCWQCAGRPRERLEWPCWECPRDDLGVARLPLRPAATLFWTCCLQGRLPRGHWLLLSHAVDPHLSVTQRIEPPADGAVRSLSDCVRMHQTRLRPTGALTGLKLPGGMSPVLRTSVKLLQGRRPRYEDVDSAVLCGDPSSPPTSILACTNRTLAIISADRTLAWIARCS